MAWKRGMSLLLLCSGVFGVSLRAQQAQATAASSTPVLLTLKRAVELALSNSKDIQMAKLQVQATQDAAQITRSEFLPNLYAGSGAGYTYGLPETPGGRPPAIFSLTYTQDILNGPLRGLAKQQQEQVRAQKAVLEDTRNQVMVRVASGYLELVKVHHALELLRAEKDSAEKIVDVTKQRETEGFELPVEVTRAQLTRAQVQQRILQLEGRQVGLGRRMLPHHRIHRWCDQYRLVGGEQSRRCEVIGKPRGHAGDQIGARRRDDHDISLAGEADMTHLALVSERPEVVIDLVLA